MRKVLVVGSGGAGKSTFSRRLAEETGLPVIHLDAFYWNAGWVATDQEEWTRTVEQLVARDRWIMDGSFIGTLDMRLAVCDTVIFLDIPRTLCLWRVIRRRIQFHGRSRPDLAEGCLEKVDWEFMRWIWNYPATTRPEILERISRLDAGKRGVVLRSSSDVEKFFRTLPQ